MIYMAAIALWVVSLVLVIAFFSWWRKPTENSSAQPKSLPSPPPRSGTPAQSPPDFPLAPGVNTQFVNDLINIMSNVPNRSESTVTTYVNTLKERARMRGYIKYAKLLEEHTATIVRILTNVTSIQAAHVELQKLLVDAHYVPLIHQEVRKKQLDRAQAGLDPEQKVEEPPKKQSTDYIVIGDIPDDDE